MNRVNTIRHTYRLTQHGRESLVSRLRQLEKEWLETVEDVRGTYTSAKDVSNNIQALNAIDTEITRIDLILLHYTDLIPERTDRVCLGSCVTLECPGKKKIYTIVTSLEVDPSNGYISENSPLGQQLLGKKQEDTVIIIERGSAQEYQITAYK